VSRARTFPSPPACQTNEDFICRLFVYAANHLKQHLSFALSLSTRAGQCQQTHIVSFSLLCGSRIYSYLFLLAAGGQVAAFLLLESSHRDAPIY
jgi:hypothetical protein